MSRKSTSATLPALALAASLASAGLAGCQALSGTSGVMPETEVGLPPSMRDTIPNRRANTANVDEDGKPMATRPTRNLDVPRSAGATTRSADTGERRIRREDLEGSDTRSGGSNSMAPGITPGGSVGLGGKF